MSNKTEFVDGLIAKAPKQNAPEYVKVSISIAREKLIAWLQARYGEWVNVDVKESRNGKWYCAVNNWKPKGNGTERNEQPKGDPAKSDQDFSDDVPF